MRKVICLVLLLATCIQSYSQGIGIGTSTPNASAQLDITSTTKGLLVPRMTSAQRTAIASPAAGLIVFDTNTNSFWFYTGSSWISVASSATSWLATGNTGTNPATNFIGTTDNAGLRFKINNGNVGYLATDGNIFWGLSSGFNNTSGTRNIGIGSNALLANTYGSNNTGIGDNALKMNTGGSKLVAVGDSALFSNEGGTRNTAIGSSALLANTIGGRNTAIGYLALYKNVDGGNNTALGSEALLENTAGINNTATGFGALMSNTTGSYNTAVGVWALHDNETGGSNTAIGPVTLESNISGEGNIAIGYGALSLNTSGNGNTALGARSLEFNTTGTNNIAMGTVSLQHSTGFSNTAIGGSSLVNLNSGNYNSALGANTVINSGLSNSSAIGALSKVDCSNCMVLGSVSGVNGSFSDINVGIGQNNPGFPLNFKSSLGDKVSFYGNSGNHYGIGIQPNLMQIFTDYNGADIGFGFGSSSSFTETMRIKGTGNLSVYGSINADQANINNGASAPGLSFGSASGEAISSKRTAGSNQYGMDFYTNFANRMSITNGGNVIVNGGALRVNDASGTKYAQLFHSNGGNLHLDAFGGGTNYISWYGGAGLHVGNGTSGGYGTVNAVAFIVTSSERYKKNISNTHYGLTEILQMQGKEYSYIFDKDDRNELGLIAEEVEKIIPEVVYRNASNHTIAGIDYGKLVPVLIEAIKQQQKQIDELKKRVDAMPYPSRQ